MTKVCMDKEKMINEGETYYLLGGGKVVNCEFCACSTTFVIIVNQKPITMERGWDKAAVVKNVRKLL
jgi:hypothetical protein